MVQYTSFVDNMDHVNRHIVMESVVVVVDDNNNMMMNY